MRLRLRVRIVGVEFRTSAKGAEFARIEYAVAGQPHVAHLWATIVLDAPQARERREEFFAAVGRRIVGRSESARRRFFQDVRGKRLVVDVVWRDVTAERFDFHGFEVRRHYAPGAQELAA